MPKRNNRKKKNYKEIESTLEIIVEVPEEIGEDVEKETVAAEKNENLDDIVSNLVGNVLNQALEEVNAEVDKNSIKNNRLNSPVAANVFVNRTNMRLYEQCSARLKDTNVLTGALREVRYIVNPTNSRNSEILKTAQRANKISQDILDWYESVEASRLDLESPEGMEEMTGYVFNEAFKALGNDMDLSERVMMSQEITNVMMKNFSNAAFAPDDFGDYADNYMLLHSDVLKEYLDEQMSGLSDKDFTHVMDNVQKHMGDKLKASDERAKERLYNKELAAIQRFDRIRRGLEVPTDESVSTDVLREYKKQCIDNIQNNNLADEIKSQMSDILIEAGVKEATAKEVADKSFNTLTNDMVELYDDLEKYPEHLENPRAMMDITTQIMVNFAISEISKQLPTKAERLVAGQEIADVILRNYSPVAFTNGKLDKYANYYIVNNADRVFKLFDMNSFNRMSREELPEFMKDVRRVLNKQGVKVSDNPNPTVEDENELVNNEPQNQIDIKTEEKPKLNEQPVEEPKAETEAPAEPEAHEEENAPVEEEAKVEEQPVNESVVEEVQETVIDYNEKHADLMIDEELAAKTKAELSQIIRDAGVTDEERASTMAGYSLQLVEMMPEVLEQHSMGDLAMYTFDQAYESLEGPLWNAIDRINAAQNITNVLMQNYSPAAFANGEMDEYKNDYVLNSRDAFINWLNTQDFTKNEINTIVENITGISVTETEEHAEFLRDREEELEIRADAASILAKKIEQDEWVRERDADLRRRAMFFSEGAQKILEDDLRRGQQEENIRNELYMAEKREAEQQKYEENFLRNREEELQGLVSQHGIYPEAFEYQEYDDAELDNEELDAEIANLEKQIEKEESMLPENAELFGNKLKTFNSMYGTNVNVNLFVSSVSNAWTLLNDDDAEKVNEGKKALSGLLNDTLKGAFEVEKQASYEEQRLPEYSEIIKSANELLRVSMFAFTDMYHNPDKAKLFIPTAFGGLREDELAELTKGDSLWDKDQRSNSAWAIQSKTAVDIAKKWLQEDKPYQTMIDEMEALVAANKEKSIDEKDIYNKLAAAEWLLLNNDKMMIEDPEDPLNKMPNWGNRYWKAITNAREKLGIPKHISMRELIQGNYAEMGKAASNLTYNKTQILEQVLDPEQRSVFDSMEKQKVEFTVQRRGLAAVNHNNEKKIQDLEITSFRMQIYVKECDERLLMENEPKSYNFEPVKAAEFSLNNSKNEEKKEAPEKEETKNNAPEL